ncbi:glycosyltransferase [Coprobacter sp.]
MKLENSDLLTICVPTCDQVVVLCEMLEDMIPKIKSYRFRLLIIDNGSSDNTQMVVKSYLDRYEGLSYIRQDEYLERDDLFEVALKLPQTPYCWVIRDINRLNESCLSAVAAVLSEQAPDLYIVNYNGWGVDIPARMYEEKDTLLRDIGWRMTQSGAVIFSRKIIGVADFEKYKGSYFFCFSVLFDTFSKLDGIRVFWSGLDVVSESLISCDNSRNPRGVFRIYGVAWSKAVLALPDVSYTEKSKLCCIRTLGKKARLYTAHHLKRQRVVGSLNPDIYKESYNYIRYFAPGNELRFFFYSRYPNRFNKYYRRYHRYYKNTGLPLF